VTEKRTTDRCGVGGFDQLGIRVAAQVV